MAVIDRLFGPAAAGPVRPPERVGKNVVVGATGALMEMSGGMNWPTGWPDSAGPTPDEALSYSPWYRAVWILASTAALTPCNVLKLRKAKTGFGKEPDTGHKFYKVVHHQANDEETAFHARLRMVAYAVVHGNALAAVYTPRRGEPELIPFQPGEWTMTRRDGQLWYLVDVYGADERDPLKRFRRLRPAQVFHLKHWSPDGLLGYATYWYARNALTEGYVGERVRVARGRNAGRPAISLSTDQALPAGYAERLQNDWVRVHEGFDGSAKPAVLDRGLKATPLPYAADQARELELSALPPRDIANFTGVPASRLGVRDGGETTEEDELLFDRYGIGFWYGAYEDEAAAKLLTEEERFKPTHAVEFDRLTRDWRDTRGRNELIRVALAGQPVAVVNEVRQLLGWSPREEPEADELQMPLNMGQGGDKNVPPNPADPGPGRPARNGKPQPPTRRAASLAVLEVEPATRAESIALNDLVEHQAGRMVKWVTTQARRHSTSPKAFADFLAEMDAEFRPRFAAEWAVLTPLGAEPVDMLRQMAEDFKHLAATTAPGDVREAVERCCVSLETEYPREVADEAAPLP